MPKYKGEEIFDWQDEILDDMPWLLRQWFRFLLAKESVEHRIRQSISFWIQRKTRGWDDSDTWSLDYTLAKQIAPRLKRFKELTNGVPLYAYEYLGIDPNGISNEEHRQAEGAWEEMLSEMVWAFEFLGSEERWSCCDQETWHRVQNALQIFSDVYTGLWW